MITREELNKVRTKAGTLKALVVGDVMLDKYIFGKVDRISPEAPVPILSHQKTEMKAGGAANVALNLAAWGCQTSLTGLVGPDNNSESLKSILESYNILHKLIVDESRPTTVKTRVVASSHHLLRIDEESSEYLAGEKEEKAISDIMDFIEQVQPDLMVIQDYNKGLLTENLIERLIHYCQTHKVFLSIDPKEQNFFNYSHANLFKPNLREASLAAQKNLQFADLPELCKTWLRKMDLGTIAITLGSQGIFLEDQHNGYHILPDRSVDVVDVCGAGDAVICSLSLGLISGLDINKSGALSNLTGAYVCSHSGVVATNPEEISNWLT